MSQPFQYGDPFQRAEGPPHDTEDGADVGRADAEDDRARATGKNLAAELEDDLRHALPHFPD